MSVINEIAAERRRQIKEEGWTPDHDDKHSEGALARAGSCYAYYANNAQAYAQGFVIKERDDWPEHWPFDPEWWKPTDRRRMLIKAAALIVAEIERMDRAQLLTPDEIAALDPAAPFPEADVPALIMTLQALSAAGRRALSDGGADG